MKDIEYIAKKKFSICYLTKKLCENFEDIKDEIIRIYYYETSELIHGKKVRGHLEAKNMFHDTLDVIQKLYSKYEPTLLSPKPLTFKRS
jgi:hypothetical protein